MKKLRLVCALFVFPLAMVAIALAAQPPHAILGAAQVGTTPAATLTWTASVTPSSTVNVYRCAGASCTAFTRITSGAAAGGPYIDSTVSAGTYTYYVTAVVNGAESAPSNTATVTISPQPPTGLSVVQ